MEGNTSTYEYLYDGNGNMIQDKNKNITLTYNFMNLPTKVNFGNGDSIVWVYTVSGAKLRKTVYDNGAVIKTIDYVSGFVYENSKLDFFNMEHGRVKRLATGSLQYQYTINDHLGNMRAMFADTNADGQADLLHETHYYPFGSEISGLSAVYTTPENKNKFTYNGKEAEEEFGLYWYHYGARYFDPQIGRWYVVDAVDEYLSVYVYVGNNPIRYNDPDGNDGEDNMLTPSNQTNITVPPPTVAPVDMTDPNKYCNKLTNYKAVDGTIGQIGRLVGDVAIGRSGLWTAARGLISGNPIGFFVGTGITIFAATDGGNAAYNISQNFAGVSTQDDNILTVTAGRNEFTKDVSLVIGLYKFKPLDVLRPAKEADLLDKVASTFSSANIVNKYWKTFNSPAVPKYANINETGIYRARIDATYTNITAPKNPFGLRDMP